MRTLDDLNARLSEERIWRIKECSLILDLAGRAGVRTAERDAYLRSGAVIIYSHWEGFIKRAATYYLRYLSYQQVPLENMAPFLLSLFLRQQIGDIGSSVKYEKIGRTLLTQPGFRPKLAYKNQIDTGSNLSSKIFQSICRKIGISDVNFLTDMHLIDDPLLKNRNAIAHGERMIDLDLATLSITKELVISFISMFKDEIENAATGRIYTT
ncbi:MAE_28990/MAE_18760 family HEPN-like nuclease [Sphingobium sp. BS19]|uniref:MAE_28990/MAE_18760 family HEPN-like nuclease n=1 Tax=Sphingobium sp. BS19 TaxID=3018973 RepID=UPI0022EF1D60|nr:MAE_28990/MAE_18760 family HEPN-like nuclease [Sphingobium sp. BS19]GLJ00475.1 hypothetical protein Sbs19_42930 [Sphingobium sp. BS19]